MSDPQNDSADTRTGLAWERTHLAAQRTVLSWTRTSIAFIVFGVALAKFSIFADLMQAQGGGSGGGASGSPGPTNIIGMFIVGVGVMHSIVAMIHAQGTVGGPEPLSTWKVWSVRLSAATSFLAGTAILIYLLAV